MVVSITYLYRLSSFFASAGGLETTLKRACSCLSRLPDGGCATVCREDCGVQHLMAFWYRGHVVILPSGQLTISGSSYRAWLFSQPPTMAPGARLCVPALLAAVSCVGGFILPSPGPTNRGTLRKRGCNGLPTTVGGSPASWAHHHRHPRRDSRRSALGPDGNEVDIIRHREAYSYAEYWDDFYAG